MEIGKYHDRCIHFYCFLFKAAIELVEFYEVTQQKWTKSTEVRGSEAVFNTTHSISNLFNQIIYENLYYTAGNVLTL